MQIALITGPNMAGKSTYIRQVALLALLAHTGSFIPAEEARIDLVDRIFTRIGASDDLSRGQSTFMVEMCETANILNNATARSLIVLDEIGRGTSTFDGLSLAWSIVEHLHNQVGAKTLFATHYHELTELAGRLPRVKNFNVAVREWHDQVVFLRKIVEGGTDKSYGIQVARLAGVPKQRDFAKFGRLRADARRQCAAEYEAPARSRQTQTTCPGSAVGFVRLSRNNADLTEESQENEATWRRLPAMTNRPSGRFQSIIGVHPGYDVRKLALTPASRCRVFEGRALEISG